MKSIYYYPSNYYTTKRDAINTRITQRTFEPAVTRYQSQQTHTKSIAEMETPIYSKNAQQVNSNRFHLGRSGSLYLIDFDSSFDNNSVNEMDYPTQRMSKDYGYAYRNLRADLQSIQAQEPANIAINEVQLNEYFQKNNQNLNQLLRCKSILNRELPNTNTMTQYSIKRFISDLNKFTKDVFEININV